MDKEQLFDQMVSQHQGIVFKVVNSYCKDSEDRKDLMQEIYLQLWKSFDKYNQDYKISTWVYRIALNMAISYYRRNSRRKVIITSIEDYPTQISNFESSHPELMLNLLERFIHELSELDRALMLLYLEKRNQSEIADILGISVSNVSTKVARIKENLKLQFSKHNI